MERDELVRLAGEQALLKKELSNISARKQRDMQELRNLPNDIGFKDGWHQRGIELLNRLKDVDEEISRGHQKLRELAKLTGID